MTDYTDYKQLCTELLRAWDGAPTPSDFVDTNGYGTIQRIRVALAQPAPKAQAEDHPITPPPELVQEWMTEIWHEGTPVRVAASDLHIANQAARWGADQELEACCEWVSQWRCMVGGNRPEVGLRAARRPKQLSLKRQALALLDDASDRLDAVHENTIRRALEQLDD